MVDWKVFLLAVKKVVLSEIQMAVHWDDCWAAMMVEMKAAKMVMRMAGLRVEKKVEKREEMWAVKMDFDLVGCLVMMMVADLVMMMVEYLEKMKVVLKAAEKVGQTVMYLVVK